MPLEKWTTLSSPSSRRFSITKTFKRLANYLARFKSRRSRQIKMSEAVFGNPMLLKKIFINVDPKTLLRLRLVNKIWLTLGDEILDHFLPKNRLELTFAPTRHSYYLNGKSKWWKIQTQNGSKPVKSLQNLSKFLESSQRQMMGRFPSFATFRFVGGNLGHKIPQEFLTQHGSLLKSLTLDLANCWQGEESLDKLNGQLKIIGELIGHQVPQLKSLYLQSLPHHWMCRNENLGTLFKFNLAPSPSDDNQETPKFLSKLKLLQVGSNLVFSKKKVFSLIDEIFDRAPNLQVLILRTWDYTNGGLFYTFDFMRKCISFTQRRSDVIIGAPYVCFDPFMSQVDLLEMFAKSKLKIALIYLCEAKTAQLPVMGRRAQGALLKILEMNKFMLRELICSRSEFIGLSQLELPKFPKVFYISIRRGKFERQLKFGRQKWNKLDEIFPSLIDIHIQLDGSELIGYWASGRLNCKIKSHAQIQWEGIIYKRGEEESIFIHN